MSNDTYRIIFTQRNTMATTFSPSAAGKTYFLKAKSARSAQHIGYATILSPKEIEVSTVSGQKIGVATSRADAAQMIDSYHRANSADQYFMWTDKSLASAK
jgi:hypothetical protein